MQSLELFLFSTFSPVPKRYPKRYLSDTLLVHKCSQIHPVPRSQKERKSRPKRPQKIGIESPKGHEHRQLQCNLIPYHTYMPQTLWNDIANYEKRYLCPIERPSCIEFCLPLICFQYFSLWLFFDDNNNNNNNGCLQVSLPSKVHRMITPWWCRWIFGKGGDLPIW